jgi:hypothetical protein
MTVHFNALAPGIAVECADENFALASYAMRAIMRLASKPLGQQFLAEFNPDRWPAECQWPAVPYKSATVLITQPDTTKPRFGSAETMKIAAAETKVMGAKEGNRRQRIVSWWPGSENSAVGQGIKIATKGAFPAPDPISGKQVARFPAADPERPATDPDYVVPGEFIYHGARENFEIVLIHELIHAYHGLHQTLAGFAGDVDAQREAEEKMVVGIYEYKGERYTENKFRFLFNFPPRDDYKSLKIKPDVTMAQQWAVWCKAGQGAF